MARPRVAIFASGSGSTAEAFIIESATGSIEALPSLVICNNPNAGILERVHKLNKKYGLAIKTIVINHKTHPDKAAPNRGEQTMSEQRAIIDAIKKEDPAAVALMGYMKKIGPMVVEAFGWRSHYKSPYEARMLNTHPGLLPETKGLYGIFVQEHVIKNSLPYSGQTLHIVAQDYDEGPTITDHKVAVRSSDTPESLFERVQVAEKKFLPKDIDEFIKKRKAYKAKKGA